MEALRKYLRTLGVKEQSAYAKRCGTSLGYLRKVLCLAAAGVRVKIGESLAIRLDRESGGAVPMDDSRPDVDWEYVRGRTSLPSRVTTRRAA